MQKSLADIFDTLERVANYEGPWTPLAKETGLLRTRLAELREREDRLDDVLVVALVGGSGVGKSTLLNALAGDELAETSEYRPCTSVPTIYHPPGARLDFSKDWHRVSGSALENLVVVDTPDSDTIVAEHREHVIDVLGKCDLIMMCGDSEKYLDEATWSLLRPLRNERTIVCVETKATEAPSVEQHWRDRLGEQNFSVDGYFRVNSLRSLDRKISGQPAGEDEYDFPALERFLSEELTRERIERIKKSNTAGLLSKTVTALDERVGSRGPELENLQSALEDSSTQMNKECFEIVRRRLFAQPHLWTFALGRETGLRAKLLVGSLFRLMEYVRTLPTRLAGWSPLSPKSSPGHRAASLLADKELVDESLHLSSGEIQNAYLTKQSELGVQYARAGFDLSESDDSFVRFQDGLNARIAEVLRGPARERVVSRARILTSWPVTILSDLPPIGFFGYSGYSIVRGYFTAELVSGAFLVHAGSVLGIILVTELFLLSIITRFFAWETRRAAARDLRVALASAQIAFENEGDCLGDALARAKDIRKLSVAVLSGRD